GGGSSAGRCSPQSALTPKPSRSANTEPSRRHPSGWRSSRANDPATSRRLGRKALSPRRHGEHGEVHGERHLGGTPCGCLLPRVICRRAPKRGAYTAFPPCTPRCLPCLRGERTIETFVTESNSPRGIPSG